MSDRLQIGHIKDPMMHHSLQWKVVRVNRTVLNSVRLNKDSFNIAEISYQTDKRHAEERD